MDDRSPLDHDIAEMNEPSGDDLLWRHLKTVPAFRALLRSVESRFYQHIKLPEPVLDLGCGDGQFASLTFRSKLTAGIDPWWQPLSKAYNTQAYMGLVQGQGGALPYRDGAFNSIISNSVLEHIADIQPVLYEVNRILAPGGRMVVTMPSHRFTENLKGARALEKIRLAPLADAYRGFFNRIARHAHVDPPELWAARFSDAGFAVERWQYYFSTKALQALEIGHVQGLPSAIIHGITGHWILAPWESNLRLTERWLRPYYEEEPPLSGTMMLFVLQKRSKEPILSPLPPSNPLDLKESDLVVTLPESEAPERVGDPGDLEQGALPVLEKAPSHKDRKAGMALLSWKLPRGTREIILALIALLAAARGVQILRNETPSITGALLWFTFASAALLLAGLPDLRTDIRLGVQRALRKMPRKRWLILISFLLVLLANGMVDNPGLENRPVTALLLWVVAIALAVFALWQGRPSSQSPARRRPLESWEVVAIVGLFFFALIVRVIQLTDHPFILNGSEASIGLDAWAVVNGQIHSPFASAWLTNPTMPAFILSVPISLFGRTALAVRILSPLIGAITVLAVYYFGRRLWGSLIGFVAALLLAGSHLHLHYSRLGMTNIWDPLLIVLALGFLYTAWQERNRALWITAGIAIGLNAYTYTGAHLLPIMLVLIAIFMLRDWRDMWDQRSAIFAALFMTLLVALPQLLYYQSNGSIFMDRVNALGIFQSGWLLRESEQSGLNPLQVLIIQLRKGLFAFQSGQDNSSAYTPGIPLLGFWPAVLMIVGVLFAMWRARQLRYTTLLIWLGVTLFFAGVLLESPPSSHRLLIALPAVYLLVSLAIVWLIYRGFTVLKRDERFVRPAIVVVTIVFVAADLFFYFGDYRFQHRFGDRNTEIANQVSEYLNSLDEQWTVYFFGAPSMYSNFPTFSFLVEGLGRDINMIDVEEPNLKPPAGPGKNTVYIFLPERSEEIQGIQETYQGGQLRILPGFHANPLSYIYEVRD